MGVEKNKDKLAINCRRAAGLKRSLKLQITHKPGRAGWRLRSSSAVLARAWLLPSSCVRELVLRSPSVSSAQNVHRHTPQLDYWGFFWISTSLDLLRASGNFCVCSSGPLASLMRQTAAEKWHTAWAIKIATATFTYFPPSAVSPPPPPPSTTTIHIFHLPHVFVDLAEKAVVRVRSIQVSKHDFCSVFFC